MLEVSRLDAWYGQAQVLFELVVDGHPLPVDLPAICVVVHKRVVPRS